MRLTKYNINDCLPKLNELIHDMWFDVDKLIFDEPKKEFRLFFGDQKEFYDQYLKISGVLSCNITDTERIGIYDIYKLSIDLKNKKIQITGCIPISITLDIREDFEITTGEKQNN